MKKKCTPEQVKNGDVVYTFEAFLKDLWKDVESTMSKNYSDKMSDKDKRNGTYEDTLKDVFVFVYDLCYLAAMNQPELELMLKRSEAKNKNVMQKTLKSNKENIALLRAIFVREISGKLEQGLTEKQALKAAVEKSKSARSRFLSAQL